MQNILQTGIMFLIFIFLIFQFIINRKQQKLYFSYSSVFDEKTIDAFYKIIDKYLKLDDPNLNEEELKLIQTNQELRYSVNMTINFFESISCAYNTGLIDKKWAFIHYCEPVIYAYDKYSKYIYYLRKENNDNLVANQIEKMYLCMVKEKKKNIKKKII